VRDAEATKAQIIDAAEEEFAKHGLNGARTEAIAKGAGITTAMIYYYFRARKGYTKQFYNDLQLKCTKCFSSLI
jgi:TetR/AcrR family transcriptional regulator